MTRRIVALLAVVALALAGGAVHPFGHVKEQGPAPLFNRAAEIDPETLQVLERSCASCHSEHANWPWYSYVAPVSWMVENDVKAARSRMNLSRWTNYTVPERIVLLSAMGVTARLGAMPPRRFTAIHPEAVLSDSERSRVYQWSRRERARLQSLTASR